MAATARQEDDMLKKELGQLKKKLKEEEKEKAEAQIQAKEMEDNLRNYVKSLLGKPPVDPAADVISFAVGSSELVRVLLQKNKAVLSRIFAMIFPKADQDKTMGQLVDAFSVNTEGTIEMSSSTPPPSTSELVMATPISSAPPPFVPVQLEPSKDSGKNFEGTLANPEETARADQMEKKAEEVATKKSKARSRDSEAKGKWWPCTTTETELRNIEAEGFIRPGSWRTVPGSLTPAPEAGEWVVTKALIERGFSFPPSDFFSEILKAYELHPHNISPNSILAISNHATLCKGHLRRIQPLQHRDHLMFQYTGRDDLMRASKDNLSSDALDKRIQGLIKIPRVLRIHVCKIDIHTNGSGIALYPFSLRNNISGNKPTKDPKKKAKPSPATMPVMPEVEVPPKTSSSAKPNPKDVINIDDLPEEPAAEYGRAPPRPTLRMKILMLPRLKLRLKMSKGSCCSAVQLNTRKLHEDLRVLVLEQKAEIEGLHQRDAESQKSIPTLETRLKHHEEQLVNHPSIDALSAELEVLKDEHASLQEFLKESSEKETREKKELEEKHAQATTEFADKLKKSNQRIKTLATKAKAYEMEAENIDKMIYPSLGFEWTKESPIGRTKAYEEARNAIDYLFDACRGIAKTLNLKGAKTSFVDRMTKLMRMVPELIRDSQ
ncbi:hypothetical protein QYE76_023802 [Lolium multiflorum]|uniref:Transposase (putative) gypsy type domain-containing protein n=1 Tax=Lolium multiflorum TaxID=4521 RepID=A0AAD8RB90_LOLMU|nr:hypothetical protein QYE76_023802 [Lolium multiflorum]